MKFYRPKSVLHLILIGFSLVALPLIVALAIATVSVDRMVSQSQQTLLQSVLVTQGSQMLVETITAMERNARQYQVLGDEVLLEVYQENHDKFIDTLRTLEALDLAEGQHKLLDELRIAEDKIHVALDIYSHDAPEAVATLDGFTGLSQTAQQILNDNRDLISRGAEQIQARAEQVQRTLVLDAVALVPAALLLSILFAFLITRPIRQVDQAIRRLGDGQFLETLVVRGPRDLEQLGERLNWLRNRLLELEQEKTKFLQHMSHELKTPLTAIRESAELMNEQVFGNLNSQQHEIVDILRDNSIQLQKLIEDLLNFSGLRTRTSRQFRDRVKLKTMIEDVLEDHKATLLSRKLDLRPTLQQVSIEGDKEKLRILVDNLVSNAIKYSPDGSPLWVLLSERDKQAVIEVVDSGPGIPEAERERVFEAFFQGAPPADKGRVRGTGLGLSIAREYAQVHGGDITVLDSGKGGARLQIVLPLEQGA
ncbi:MAG: HAMP domain-containing protein [Gammaproteobacteria bacterium]|nr:MAG: HAMP domain-containing protein [Gammaproteobacteria bacterium]